MRKPFLRNSEGTVAVEFAAVSVVFFAILFGIITFGLQLATRIGLSYAVAQGGRAAMAGLNDAERTSLATSAIGHVLDAYYPLIDADNAAISVQSIGTTEQGTLMEVSIAYSDSRFYALPFVPSLSDLPPMKTTFLVVDGSS